MLAYSPEGLFVTWARIHPSERDGVERYLAETLRPLVGTRHPNAAPIYVVEPPIPVNLPW